MAEEIAFTYFKAQAELRIPYNAKFSDLAT